MSTEVGDVERAVELESKQENRSNTGEIKPAQSLLDELYAVGRSVKKALGLSASSDSVEKTAGSSNLPIPHLDLIDSSHDALNDAFQAKANDDATLHQLRRVDRGDSLNACLEKIAALPLEQRSNFFHSINSILNDSKSIPNAHMREQLASDVIRQIANPALIKEGYKGTCALATTEIAVATERPDAYAQSISEWIRFGKLVSLSSGIAQPGDHPGRYQLLLQKDDGAKDRSLASRVFQTATANLAMARSGLEYVDFNPANAPFIQSVNGPYKPDRDTGERTVDTTGKIMPWSGLASDDQIFLLDTLTGKHHIADKVYPKSPTDLVDQLREIMDKNHSPMLLSVHYTSGGHAIAVLGVDAAAKKSYVNYANTAIDGTYPRKLTANALYDATIDGNDVVRIGDPKQLDGYTYRLALPLHAGDRPFVEVVHAQN